MEEKYFVLYKRGDCQPLGVVRGTVIKQLMLDLRAQTCSDYLTEPVTKEQAQKIRNSLTGCSKGLEEFLS